MTARDWRRRRRRRRGKNSIRPIKGKRLPKQKGKTMGRQGDYLLRLTAEARLTLNLLQEFKSPFAHLYALI